jgi:hypothetical protein
LNVRALAVIMGACVPPRACRVSDRIVGATWYCRRDDYLKEISKEGGPRANRRSTGETTRTVRRKPGKKKASYARRRQIAGLVTIVGVLLIGVLLFASLGGGDDEIAGGVSIGSVDVGGMSRAEAEKTVKSDAAATFQKISFGTGEDGFTVSGEDLGVEVNAGAACSSTSPTP